MNSRIVISSLVACAALGAALVTPIAASAADAIPMESAHVSVGHSIGGSQKSVVVTCPVGYHIDARDDDDMLSAKYSTHGKYIQPLWESLSDATTATEKRTLTVTLENYSFLSNHDGWVTTTCMPDK